MKGPSLVPWVNGSELLAVFSLLFDKSGSVSERFASASSILTSWSHRGEVPLAIESTLNIVNVILLDLNMFYGNSISNMSSGNVPLGLEELFDFPEPSEQPLFTNAPCAMSLSYAATIIRFVNGIVDAQQQKMYAQSVSKLAELQDLPRFFVDARHEATHDRIPPLDYLRELSVLALSWLKRTYWDGMKMLYSYTSASNIDDCAEDMVRISLLKYQELFIKTLPYSDPKKSYLNMEAIPRPISKAVSDFYAEYEAAVFSLSLQRHILSFVIVQFQDPSVFNYESIVWSHLLSPIVLNCPLFIELVVGSLIYLPSTHLLLERLFSIWLHGHSALSVQVQIINRICEILFNHIPTEYSFFSISFLKLIREKFFNLLHPLLLALVDKTLHLDGAFSNESFESLPKAFKVPPSINDGIGEKQEDEIDWIRGWRVSPLGSVDPIFPNYNHKHSQS